MQVDKQQFQILNALDGVLNGNRQSELPQLIEAAGADKIINIDLMNLAGFCRNCLSRWYREEAGKKGVEVPDPKAREIVYGMPYDEWKTKYQKEASADQKKAFDKAGHKH